ncbi:hypothetical protein EOW77_0035275 [Bradyrhizobium yuanmingense]|uniref:hypothetical protein n=1 Tax=Bradyrhizobium yuanmingense TaxID=108015 RepID=UPI000FE43031|nr:hypothetical protein [Bradyrhizobium yuanmingense]TGN73356.1 hypothetical protein EOW77_0035275 [Bradyrhizobium yuanmingense]
MATLMETRCVEFSMSWYADDSNHRASVRAAGYTDMRRGFVQEVLRKDSLSGMFVIRGRRSDLVKVWHDGQRPCLFTKDSREEGSSDHRLRVNR